MKLDIPLQKLGIFNQRCFNIELATLRYQINVRVTHFAKTQKSFAATSFSHSIYLVRKDEAKKIEKKYRLGVIRHPPWFM